MTKELIFEACSVFFNIICAGLAAIVGYRNRKKFLQLKFLYIYPLASFIELMQPLPLLIIGLNKETIDTIGQITIHFFLLAEFLVLYNFFNKVLSSKIIKKIMQTIAIVYSLTMLVFLVLTQYSFIKADTLYILQGVIILLPTLCYFAELFKKTIVTALTHKPYFWIATGSLFFLQVHFLYFLCRTLLSETVIYMNKAYTQSIIYFMEYFFY